MNKRKKKTSWLNKRMTETRLTVKTDSSFEIPEYKSYSFYRKNQVGDGLKKNINSHLNIS